MDLTIVDNLASIVARVPLHTLLESILEQPNFVTSLAHTVMSGFNVSLNSQVKFEVSWFGACSGCPSYKYRSGH